MGKKPFSEDEQKIMDLLIEAHGLFVALDKSDGHPSDALEWQLSFHRLQSILMNRVLARDYPDVFTSNKSLNG